MASTPVGVAFIEILPDFTGFRSKLVAGLEAQLAGIHAAIPATVARVQGAVETGVAGAVSAQVPEQLSLLADAEAAVGSTAAAASAGVEELASAEVALGTSSTRTAAEATGLTTALRALGIQTQQMVTHQAEATGGSRLLQAGLLGVGQGAISSRLAFFGLGGAVASLAVGGVAASVVFAGRLEQSLKTLGVVTNATSQDLADASAEAQKLGADVRLPAVTAATAADAMTLLARAGLNVQDSISGARGVLVLAAAAQTDAATAALTVARNLNAFQLAGTQASHVADLLAGASITGGVSIQEMGDALSASAAAAHQLGIPIDDLVTSLAEVARRGLQGEQGGTALRNALIRLTNPTAAARRELQALGVSITDARGNFIGLPTLFEQFRVALEGLTPVQQQAALATIFGTRAFRAIALAAQEGRAGFEAAAQQTERQGIASDVAAARMSGFLGQLRALGSTAQSTATRFGSALLPELEAFLTVLNETATATDRVIAELQKLGGIHIPGGARTGIHDVGDAFKFVVEQGNPITATLSRIQLGLRLIRGDAEGAAQSMRDFTAAGVGFNAAISDFNATISGANAPPTLGLGDVHDQILELQSTLNKGGVQTGKGFAENIQHQIGLIDPGVAVAALKSINAEAATAGKNVGEAFGLNIGKGITDADIEAVTTARATLRRVTDAGNEAIQNAVVSAKQNLAQLGATLAQQIGQLIDAGPLGQQIKRLQDKLNSITARQQTDQLKQGLQSARKELEDAQRSVVLIGQPTAAQRAGVAAFLDPFQQKVKDAQEAISTFNLQGTITDLQEEADKKKSAVAQFIDDLIAKFNSGKATLSDLNVGIATALKTAGLSHYQAAAKTLGFAFTQSFAAEIAGIKQQAEEAIAVPSRATGAEPNIVSVTRQVAISLAEQQKARDDLQKALDRKAQKQVDALENISKVMDLIRPLLKPQPAKTAPKPSPSTSTKPKPTGVLVPTIPGRGD